MSEQKYKIKEVLKERIADDEFGYSQSEVRFVITDLEGKIIDDAQGWGYTTAQNAHKAAWYKLNGGRKKKQKQKSAAKKAIKSTPEMKDFVLSARDYNGKQLATKEIKYSDFLESLKKDIHEKFGIWVTFDVLNSILAEEV